MRACKSGGRPNLTPATVTRIKALVSIVFNHALEDQLISLNPASRLGKYIPKGRDRKEAVKPLIWLKVVK